jgi:hypothetical protein
MQTLSIMQIDMMKAHDSLLQQADLVPLAGEKVHK